MSSHQPMVVVVRGGEHELVLLCTSVLVGLGMLFAAPAPVSVLTLMPPWVVTLWAATWLLSGVAGSLALLLRGNLNRALHAERAALVINAAAVVLFTISAFAVSGWRAWAAGLFLAGWSVANLVRAYRIGHEIRQLIVLEGR